MIIKQSFFLHLKFINDDHQQSSFFFHLKLAPSNHMFDQDFLQNSFCHRIVFIIFFFFFLIIVFFFFKKKIVLLLHLQDIEGIAPNVVLRHHPVHALRQDRQRLMAGLGEDVKVLPLLPSPEKLDAVGVRRKFFVFGNLRQFPSSATKIVRRDSQATSQYYSHIQTDTKKTYAS